MWNIIMILEVKDGLVLQILMVCFDGILDNGWVEDLQMMKEKLLDGKSISRFKGKLIKMIKDVNGRFDDYSISPKNQTNFITLEL